MKIKEVLCEGLSQDAAKDIIFHFIKFVKEYLSLPSLPTIQLFPDNQHSTEYRSFGGYGNGKIILTVSNRHIMDVCRTLAHELVHYKQDLQGQITDDSGKDGSAEENEANAVAAVIMRKWGKQHPSLFSKLAIE